MKLSTLTPATPIWLICTYIGLMGVGLGASLQILVLVLQNSFPMSMVGVATATNNYFRQVGAAVGYLIAVVVITVALLFFVIEKPLATTPEGEVVAHSLDISGTDTVALATATVAAREIGTVGASVPGRASIDPGAMNKPAEEGTP